MQIQVQDECDFEGEEAGGDIGLERNTNAASIQQAEREKREQAKLDSQKKKEKDKEDRYTYEDQIRFKSHFIFLALIMVFINFLLQGETKTTASRKERKAQASEV